MKKVLIITYYWPPSGGSGVQRWLKFVKYLPSFDWKPHVFTPENPSFAVRDVSLEADVPAEAEVIRFPIWEPYDIFYRFSGWFGPKKRPAPTVLVPDRNRSLYQNIGAWIRGNFFIPDPRRFWIKPSVKFLSDYVTDNEIETIITTGPPHSLHLIGLALKSRLPQLRWLADFRDPWTEWGLWDSLRVTQPVRRIHKQLEARVLAVADEIITITPFYAKRFEQLARREVILLTNGFDEDDFEAMVYSRPDDFIIRHVGIVNEKCDPRPFMSAMKALTDENPAFASQLKIEFIGEVHPDFREYVAGMAGLKEVTVFSGSMQHRDLIKMYGSSALLLLILTGYKDGEGFLPGKLFEYIVTRLPVLGVGPVGGDAAALLKETGAGAMIESGDDAGMRRVVLAAYDKWRAGASVQTDHRSIEKFSRRSLTARLADILSLS